MNPPNREDRDDHYEECYERVPSLFRPASPCQWGPAAGFSPGDGNKALLHLSSLLSVQSLRVSCIHCKLLHPPSWQEDSWGPQGSVRHRSNGSALIYVCPLLLSQCSDQDPKPFPILLEAPLLRTPACGRAPTVCGIESPVDG